MSDPDAYTRELAAASLAEDDPSGWFERLYTEASRGAAVVPWDRGSPHQLLVDWVERERVDGRGRRAVVVGCGLGQDAELMARLGFDTVAFDVAETGVRTARERFPDSPVAYVVADLLTLPDGWRGAFDLVVESLTVQALPPELHAEATTAVTSLVGPGGTLLVISGRAGQDQPGPPWPLRREEIEAFGDGLRTVRIEEVDGRWRAEFRRSAA